MAFNFNGIPPESIIFTDKGVTTMLDKLIFNGVTVWENWKYMTGSLVKMTSNSTPSPFTATQKGWARGSSYMAFDGSLDNYMYSNNPNADGDITSTLMFGQAIKIAQITAWIAYGGPVLDNYDEPDPESGVSGGWGAGNKNWLKLYGIKADRTQVLLATHENYGSWADTSGSKRVHIVSAENQKIPFVGLTCHRGGKSGPGWYRLYDIQITQWYQKGSSQPSEPDIPVVEITDDGLGNVVVKGIFATDDGFGNVTVRGF